MASDRARISFDPTRAYRAVVAQQGRVTLEADVNEAAMIENESLRLETIDIIGPAGTPSVPAPGDGYKVVPGATPDKTVIHDGLYYLGGWRLNLDQPVELDSQPDWLDRPADVGAGQGGNDVVSLLITEQSVCAVEDKALREVALGGPDSAARLRLMQQFLLTAMTGDTCADGLTAVEKLLAADGVSLDPYSYQLLSSATLQVGFVPDSTPPDPCTPAAAGGYLGADNQLVRVTVSAFDPKAGTGSLVWGWNNASFLYRATLTDKAAGVLTLAGQPLDQEHAPQLGQAVEILRSRADLKDGNYIAADAGFVTTVTQAYSFDTGTLTIDNIADLPPDYLSDPNPLFVRLWQAIVPFTAGQPAALDTASGVTVTVNLTALPSHIAARPFWRFAVRPDTPVQVYPARYQQSPQPPDGPRQWICDLGVIGPQNDAYALLADCRPKFTPLTDQTGGCCGLTLDPEGVSARGGLQAVVDSLVGGPAVLSLQAGEYILPKPLVLTGDHKRLTIEGCSHSVSIRPDPNKLDVFRFGLMVIDKADAITLRRLEFDVPMVPTPTGGTVAGVLVGDSGLIVIEDCAFGIRAPNDGRVGETRVLEARRIDAVANTGVTVFGGAIALVGRVVELSVRRNRFVGKDIFHTGLVCGVIGSVNAGNIRTTLEGVEISENYFERLNAAVFAYAKLGEIRCDRNRIRECYVGFFFSDTRLGAAGQFAKQAVTDTKNTMLATVVQQAFPVHWMADSIQSQAEIFTRVAPPASAKAPAPSAAAKEAVLGVITTRGQAAYKEISAQPIDGLSGVFMRTRPVPAGGAAPAPGTAPTGANTVAMETAQPLQARPIQGAGEATAAGPAAAPDSAKAYYLSNLDHVQTVAAAAELVGASLTTSLHVHDNDMTLIKTPPGHAAGVGIGTLLSPRDDHGMVLISGNRIVCPNTHTSGAVLWFSSALTATGNMIMQPGVDSQAAIAPAFLAVGLGDGHFAYAGNVFHTGAFILPVRSAPAPSPDWAFLNAVS